MKNLIFLILSLFIIGTNIKAETLSKEKYETKNVSEATTEWTFSGNLVVETETKTLFDGSSTITAISHGSTIDLTINGITIVGIPINLTLPNLPYTNNKILAGTQTEVMGYTATFDEDCNIREGYCGGVFLTIENTPSGTIYVTFQ